MNGPSTLYNDALCTHLKMHKLCNFTQELVFNVFSILKILRYPIKQLFAFDKN
jgi:hypothetical protein